MKTIFSNERKTVNAKTASENLVLTGDANVNVNGTIQTFSGSVSKNTGEWIGDFSCYLSSGDSRFSRTINVPDDFYDEADATLRIAINDIKEKYKPENK
jgi:hypothetical protein